MNLKISVNKSVLKKVNDLITIKDELRIEVEKTENGATLIDAGVKAEGGFQAGRNLAEICMGGLGQANITVKRYGDIDLPSITVTTDFPAIALLGSQFAGWQIKTSDYFAMGSGPARALALKPKKLYDKIDYKDEADSATIILETTDNPTTEAINYIAETCGVNLEQLFVLIVSTSSLTGSTQISGRIVETGLHKLVDVGFDPKLVLQGSGFAPIAPIHPKFKRAMGRTNDALLYGGSTFFTVKSSDDEELKRIVNEVPSSTSKDYGKSFYETFKGAGFDFYKIDPALFAPARITVNNVTTGSIFSAGQINTSVLKESFFEG